MSVQTYNVGTWNLTKAELNRLDMYHRPHLRQIAAIHWPHRISNETLYRRCRCRPISEVVLTAQWRLFGHVFRMSPDAPSQPAIDYYFVHSCSTSVRSRPRTTLPTALGADMRRIGCQLRCPAYIAALRSLDREQWLSIDIDNSADYV